MINPKNICISASIGFFLSFIIGLFSDVHFSIVVLRAFIFALIYAVLTVGITFLYNRFLSSDSGGFSVDSDVSNQKVNAGNIVNIVVDDSNLPDENASPRFKVLNNHKAVSMEEADTVSNSSEKIIPSPAVESVQSVPAAESVPASVTPASSESSAFKSLNLGTSQAPEAVGQPKAENTSDGQKEAGSQQLDELPDISEMQNVPMGDVGSELDSPSGGEIVSDSEFATAGTKLKEQPISGDTSIMAKAIQTLLANDE